MSQASIYQYNQRAEILVPIRTGTTYYGPTHARNLIFYKGLNTDIEFFAKDTDRKPQSLVNKIYTATIIDRASKQAVHSQPLQVIDYDLGQMVLKLSHNITSNLETKLYDMVVTYQIDGETGSYAGMSDQNNRITFAIELKDGNVPQLRDSETSTVFTQDGNDFVGAQFAGPAQVGNQSGIQTGVVYTTSYTGTYKWQASLSLQPLTNDWFDTGTSGNITSGDKITSDTFVGMYQWVRLVHTPNVSNIGTLDKVTYRS